MKVCSKCKILKQLVEFNKKSSAKDGRRPECKICHRLKCKEYHIKNIDKIAEYGRMYRKNNPDKITATRHKHYSNPEKRERRRIKERDYLRKKRRENPLTNLKLRYRSRLYKFCRMKFGKKLTPSFIQLLGCSPEQFKIHFESLFTEGMTWDKVLSGEIHIDHITPLSTATSEEELIKLSHYSNLQPLWAEDNLKKSDKLA